MLKKREKAAGNVTIKHVAKYAGVSLGTVSRVLNDAANIDPALRLRVEQVIKELGYKPNPVAQTLRSRQSRVIGVVLPDIQNPLTAAAVTGLEPVLQRAGYTLFLANTHSDREREREILDQFQRRQVDGVIAMVANDDDAETRDQLQNLAVPLVLLEREMDVDVDRVLTNQFEGTYRATRYLLGLGHRRICLITVPAITYSGRERIRGFSTAFTDLGLESTQDLIHSEGREHPYGRDAAYSSLTTRAAASAIICSGGHLAGVIEAVRLLNLQIPRDLSIVTLGDTELAALIEPPVTAIQYDWMATGRCAADLLVMQLSEGRQGERRRIVVPHEFLIRGSCAPFPNGAGSAT
ncbi:LacI family DNA-binding transcriptional regulator [Mesorhizobium sp. B2-6-1]|uniref:LacI family DNA-binding transcriptional regulator n=1 Tax=Mesorhizobium sp. B2-6-1 TaxID=2589916 RepID=UPI00112784B1|nr:LacI family DNA-binding transcriptional regulator [Mesorhizobium sp. B2-6-1]TPJ57643.1 LacI family transcriptional regulator [Mesorhizobium sp. B2-6-1]